MVGVNQRCAPSRDAEASLIGAALDGGSEAFGELVEPHLGFLSAFARRRLRSEPDAEDAVQEAVLMAFRHLRQYRGTARFRGWLAAIALNEMRQTARGWHTARTQPLPDSMPADLSDNWFSPDVQCERKERIEQLYSALVKLPKDYRIVIQLRDLREFSITETARMLSLSSGAVRTRHHRARKMLFQSMMRKQRGVLKSAGGLTQ
jgi:RNA polymerase sigma-70 factor (ECF subfamily)